MFKIINFLDKDKDLAHTRQELRKKLKDLKHATEQKHDNSAENLKKQSFKNFLLMNEETNHNSESQTHLDDYTMSKILGQGSYAVVKLATHKKTGIKVAIKAYDKVRLLDPQKMKNVKNEIANLRELDHPAIIKLYKSVHTVKQIF